ncbi:MAG: ABC transporter ATP-binding protein/permease [Candidatus Pacebacteria bacterium]|nr:ABC transporter ATP-binding protein/permease [Candidatus Paceibacterota bacterium]MCF7862933.1 ABC transporter ATP-binding protein/permease [Candidatus Paceibacterota bacterium]
MKTEPKNFSWLDVPKSILYFLEEDKKKWVFSVFVLSIVLLYNFVPTYIVGKMVDFFSAYSTGDSLKVFYQYIVFLGVSYVIISLIRIHSKRTIDIIGIKTRMRARAWGFERLTEFSLEWHNKENTGNKLQRVFTGSDALRAGGRFLTRDGLKIFIHIIVAVVIFIFADWKLATLVSIYIVIFMFVEMTLSRKIYSLSNQFNKFNQSAGGVYMEGANNMLAIKALGSTDSISARIAGSESKSKDIGIEKIKLSSGKWKLFQFVNGTSLMIFMYILGKGVISGTFTLGAIVVFFTYFIKLRDSLGDFSGLHSELIDIRSDLSQMMPIFTETEFIKTGNESFPKNWDKIEIKNAFMDYGSGQMGLKDFSLTLKRNTKNGIAGLSGSGKSTLAKVILGLYALKSGGFKIGEKDYYSIAHNDTLGHLTVVLQETELFNLSLRDNITMMRAEDSNLLEKAVEISQLKEVINKLPEGLDSMIGEKGYMLSGGERQRLGIARAIYKNAPIIILDEATSSLDSETEGKIMEKLLGVYGEEKTFLIIAHRLGTLKYTDNIAVMEEGRVVEEGSYDKLMNKSSSVFYRMNQEQKIKKDEGEK